MTRPAPLLTLFLAAVLLAILPSPAPAAGKAAPLVEGTDYVRIEDGQPYAPAAGKIEVVEVFGYTCPHCAHFEPLVAAWRAKLPGDVRFTPVAAPFGSYWMPYARAYYTARALGVAERSHAAVFRALHEDGALPRNPSADELAAFYTRFGVPAARFLATYAGQPVEAEMTRARAFIERSGVEGTPSLVVNGRYRVLGSSLQDQLRIADALIARERAARGR